jgi:hypothetical protein
MSTNNFPIQALAFIDGGHLLIQSDLPQVALAVKQAYADNPNVQILVFDAITSHVIDLDLRGSDADTLARLTFLESPVNGSASASASAADAVVAENTLRGRGRPKLGVVAREVTLLPRHWEWLNQQTGGASVALRKLVEEARRGSDAKQQARVAMECAYRFMSGMAGAQPLLNFEEATRALFAGDEARFSALITPWPADVSKHLLYLAQAAFSA